MNYSSRFWLYAPISLFALIAAWVMIHWWVAAGAFGKRLDALKGHQVLPGVTIDWDSRSLSGFPFRLDADFTGLRITGAAAHGPFAWRSEKFAAHALTYGRAKTVYEAAGKQQLRWTDAGGREHAIAFLPGSLRASSVLDGRGLARFDLDILDVAGQDVAIGRFQLHMRRDPDGRDLDLMLRADAMQGMGAPRKLVEVYATLNKGAAFAGLLQGAASWPVSAQNWRARGGAAKLSRITAPGLAPDALLSPLY